MMLYEMRVLSLLHDAIGCKPCGQNLFAAIRDPHSWNQTAAFSGFAKFRTLSNNLFDLFAASTLMSRL